MFTTLFNSAFLNISDCDKMVTHEFNNSTIKSKIYEVY